MPKRRASPDPKGKTKVTLSMPTALRVLADEYPINLSRLLREAVLAEIRRIDAESGFVS